MLVNDNFGHQHLRFTFEHISKNWSTMENTSFWIHTAPIGLQRDTRRFFPKNALTPKWEKLDRAQGIRSCNMR